MRKIIIITALVFIYINTVAQSKLFIDSKKSEFVWIGKKIGGEHKGNIIISSGELNVSKDNQILSASFEVDMGSITCSDLSDKSLNSKLVGHLKSPDFFDTEKYPKAFFTIKPGTKIEKGSTLVKGELTIKGIKKPIEFKAMFVPSSEGQKVFANFSVDRSKFNVKYGSGSFFENLGDKAIYDDFDVFLNLVFTKDNGTAEK